MRSQYEKHYDNGDGTYTAIIDTVPIHYNNENGEWVEIDNTLIQMMMEVTLMRKTQ